MMIFFFQKLLQKRKRAETILEVLVSIFVVAIGSAASTSLVVDALRSNGLSRDNLIAMNLAVEGQEAMRGIRDSNWLKFSYDRDNCWNLLPDKTACNANDPQFKDDVIPGDPNGKFFTPLLNTETMGWELIQQEAELDLNKPGAQANNANFMLYLADTNDDEEGDLYVASDSPLPNPSKFYRMVTITYPSASPVNEKEMTVTSIVQWNDRGVHQVKLVSKLTDYLKVKVK